jgi:hypothetical protein
VTPKTEVKNVKIFIETHPPRGKNDAEHAVAIIFTPKSSKTDEFSHPISQPLFTFAFFIFFLFG